MSTEGTRLRFSERKQIAETGALGPLTFDQVPDPLRTALMFVLAERFKTDSLGKAFKSELHRKSVEHFGWAPSESIENWIQWSKIDELLDFVEIVAEIAPIQINYRQAFHSGGSLLYRTAKGVPFSDFETKYNQLSDRHRFGYRLQDGLIQQVGSPALSEVVIGPALLSTNRTGWEHVDRSFREALHHQRGPKDENDDALTAANAALESALKASGISGNNLGQLADGFKRADFPHAQISSLPSSLAEILKRVGAVRNTLGDAHGRHPGSDASVPDEIVDLAIHITGSFIVYLAAVSSSDSTES